MSAQSKSFNRPVTRTEDWLALQRGAITATLLAAGYIPEEMLAAVNERLPNGEPRFSSFMDAPSVDDFADEVLNQSLTASIFAKVNLPLIPYSVERIVRERLLDALLHVPPYRQLFCFIECGGFFSGSNFLEWIQEKLAAKGVSADATLRDFAEKTKSDLSLIASDVTDKQMLVLNHRTAPDCPVAWAVRMSMSIPFVWREVVWQGSWGTYLGLNKTGNTIVDGGLLSNFPIRLVDNDPDDDPFVMEVMGDTVASEAGTLGLLIDENLPVPGTAGGPHSHHMMDHLHTVQRVSRVMDTMMRAQDNVEIREQKCVDRLLDAYQEGLMELDGLRKRMPEMRRRQNELRSELERLEIEAANQQTFLRLAENMEGFLVRLRNRAQIMDVIERQKVLWLVVKEIQVGLNDITIKHSIPGGGNDAPPGSVRQDEQAPNCLLRSGSTQPLIGQSAPG